MTDRPTGRLAPKAGRPSRVPALPAERVPLPPPMWQLQQPRRWLLLPAVPLR